jgi:hypothetical protein
MQIMFNMMNTARMSTGLQALSYASAAYLSAANYAKERVQGRDLKDFKNHAAPSVPIINHPDVRRNLLWMKAYVDGMRSFFYYTVNTRTQAGVLENEDERHLKKDLFELLTPLIKCYLSDMGYEVCVQAIQVYGGAGYIRDYPVEQYARDCKITSIYEGTSGVQAMDLLGRKIGMKEGRVFMAFLQEIQHIVAMGKKTERLAELAADVETLVNRLGEVAMHLGQTAMSPDFKVAFAHSLPFLYAMGDTIMAWMLLWRAVVATNRLGKNPKKKDVMFYDAQIKTAEFFIKTIGPVALGKMKAIQSSCAAAVELPAEAFGGA